MSWRQRETISPPAGSSWEPCAPEGFFTALLVTLGVLTVGSLLLWAEGILIKQRLAYFVFQYPTLSLALCLILLFFLCGALPLSMYRKTEKQPVVERMKAME